MTRVKPRHQGIRKSLASVILQGIFGGDSWTRTNDPIDVNDVLYRLSHATLSEHSGFKSYRLFGNLLDFPGRLCERLASTSFTSTLLSMGILTKCPGYVVEFTTKL